MHSSLRRLLQDRHPVGPDMVFHRDDNMDDHRNRNLLDRRVSPVATLAGAAYFKAQVLRQGLDQSIEPLSPQAAFPAAK